MNDQERDPLAHTKRRRQVLIYTQCQQADFQLSEHEALEQIWDACCGNQQLHDDGSFGYHAFLQWNQTEAKWVAFWVEDTIAQLTKSNIALKLQLRETNQLLHDQEVVIARVFAGESDEVLWTEMIQIIREELIRWRDGCLSGDLFDASGAVILSHAISWIQQVKIDHKPFTMGD